MQKEMATIEQVAQDNHDRARRLMKELNQMQHEYTELKKQVCPAAPAGSPGQRGLVRHTHAPGPQTEYISLIALKEKYIFVETES